MSLQTLPYDLLFHIAQYLDIDDVHNLQATCKSLRTFTLTRPVYRSLAYTLLSRSRPLPLPAFHRLADLSTKGLIKAVNRANKSEKAWQVRAPRPAPSSPSSLSWYTKLSVPANEEIDWLSPITSSYALCATKSGRVVCWDVARDICLAEWDPRTLAARLPTMPGSPQDGRDNDGGVEDTETGNKKKWELWKCRVEFDEQAVYFTMARVLKGSYDDDRVMEFVLMKLVFPSEAPEHASPSSSPTWNPLPIPCDASQPKTPPMSPPASEVSSSHGSALPTGECLREEYPGEPNSEMKPVFFPLTSFYTTGVVMNVFLLDPPRYLLSAFVWVASSNTIGLYVLLDWTKDEYVFVDTGVGCLISSNWSCILHEDQIVIHSEEAEAAHQYFYPLNILRTFTRPRKGGLKANGYDSVGSVIDTEIINTDCQSQDSRYVPHDHLPLISTRLPPVKSLSKKFVFPRRSPNAARDTEQTMSPLLGVSVSRNASGDDLLQETVAESSSSVGPSGHQSRDVETVSSGTNMDRADTEIGPMIAEGSSKSRGKARATDGDTIAEDGSYSSAPESSRKNRETTPDNQALSEDSDIPSRPSTPGSSSVSAPQEQTTVLQPTELVPIVQSPDNPYPFPPWYPESAHFVRQWWPTLPGVPRLSCTVVLLAAHDPATHRTRFVLAQHYFRVPITHDTAPDTATPGSSTEDDDEMLHIWYVSTPFEVVCVLDSPAENGDEEDTGDRPRPLVAVDFGHAVWVEYVGEPGGVYGVDASRLVANASSGPVYSTTSADSDEEDRSDAGDDASEVSLEGLANGSTSQGHDVPPANPHEGDGSIFDPRRHRVPKCLRFVTFPPVYTAYDRAAKQRTMREEAVVRTLDIPEELDLDGVETINIDQSQGAVILSVKDGKIFILRYE